MTVKRTSWKFGTITIVAISLIAGLGYRYARLQNESRTKPVIAAEAHPVVATSVSAWGRLAPQSDVIPLSAAANQLVACVEQLLVGEGDQITVGQPIAILDSHERRKATVDEAQARVASAQAKLSMVRAGAKPEELAVQQAVIDVHQAELDDAAQQHDRGNSLQSSNSISAEEHAQRVMRWKKASATLIQATLQLQSMKSPREEDVAFAVA
jgi:HlyD family secretion protein